MKRETIALGAGLLIALFAVAALPSASAYKIIECDDPLDNGTFGGNAEEKSFQDCVQDCPNQDLDPVTGISRCLVFG